MVKDRLVYAVHILDTIETLQGMQLTHDIFVTDTIKYHATYRLLQLITESAKRLDGSLVERHPEINWAGIRGFRNAMVHDYLDLNDAVAWDIVQNHVPQLYAAILAEVPNWPELRSQKDRVRKEIEGEYGDV